MSRIDKAREALREAYESESDPIVMVRLEEALTILDEVSLSECATCGDSPAAYSLEDMEERCHLHRRCERCIQVRDGDRKQCSLHGAA